MKRDSWLQAVLQASVMVVFVALVAPPMNLPEKSTFAQMFGGAVIGFAGWAVGQAVVTLIMLPEILEEQGRKTRSILTSLESEQRYLRNRR